MSVIFDELGYSCENCPCINSDCDYGYTCNLGYTTDLFWGVDRQLGHMSKDCKLVSVRTDCFIFRRSKKMKWTHIHPDNWDEKRKGE
jgi:hypothetical protein